MNKLAQAVIENEEGRLLIEGDWYGQPLPVNAHFEEMAYPDTSYSFKTFFSKSPRGFSLGYASGNYGHCLFTTGEKGEIGVGKYVVLQGIRMICNKSITIKDHCMFSWGSVITDTWLGSESHTFSERRAILENVSKSFTRHLETRQPKPVVIEENVWVGFDAIILPGIRIGRGAVIGCKSVVTENVPEYAVVVGNPGRVIKFLEADDTEDVKQLALQEFAPVSIKVETQIKEART